MWYDGLRGIVNEPKGAPKPDRHYCTHTVYGDKLDWHRQIRAGLGRWVTQRTEGSMSGNNNLIEVGTIYHSTMGTDESWATLYFDAATSELVVIESSDTTGMYPRYSPTGRGLDSRMVLRQFLEANSSYREKVIQLVTEKLGR